MIAHDFRYARADTKEEALALYLQAQQAGMKPLYYGAGSEIITMCRAGSIAPDWVIDLKRIPEMNLLRMETTHATIGACVSLRAIQDAQLFPLLGLVCGRIADHTNQCRITLGGNLCGTIIYRETCQPLWVGDAKVLLFGVQGLREVSFANAFQSGRLDLAQGEMLLGVQVPREVLHAQHIHVKRTSGEKIDYPLISMSMLHDGKVIRLSVSGLYNAPFRSRALEDALNRQASRKDRIEAALQTLPKAPNQDHQGSSAYRLFMLKCMLESALERWQL